MVSPTVKTDINTKTDIYNIVDSFYKRLLKDPAIGFFFTDIANIDIETHLPQVTNFWAFQVLGEIGYKGDMYNSHKHIHQQSGLRQEHFDWWLVLFKQAVDLHAAGENAERMKYRAQIISNSMASALKRNEPKLTVPGVNFYTPN